MTTWLLVCAILLWVGAVGVLAVVAFGLKFSLAGSPTDHERNEAAHYEIALALVLVTGPALAAASSTAARRGNTVVVLVALSAVMVVPALYVARVGIRDGRVGHTTPTPVVTQCIPRSGSTRGCPGG